MSKHLCSLDTGKTLPMEPLFTGSPDTGGALEVEYDYDWYRQILNADWFMRSDSKMDGIWRYSELLPIDETSVQPVTLGEGNTPLVRSRNVGPAHGLHNLFYKNETVNPTWSQKDRTHTVMATKAKEFGYRRVVTTSTGNHGASAAAYSAAAGLEACVVFCPYETSQLLLRFINSFGGTAIVSAWNGREALLKHMVKSLGWYPATGLGPGVGTNPYGLEGYKSIAYEIVRQLGDVPHRVMMSVASGDSFYGVWKGFRELHRLGWVQRTPQMWACQPTGADVISRSLGEGLDVPLVLENPQSVAISTREPTSGAHVLRSIRESNGGAITVDDVDILKMMQAMGRDGLCVETASALPAAAAVQLAEQGRLGKEEHVVCVVTAAGIKWPETLTQLTSDPIYLESNLERLGEVLSKLALAA